MRMSEIVRGVDGQMTEIEAIEARRVIGRKKTLLRNIKTEGQRTNDE